MVAWRRGHYTEAEVCRGPRIPKGWCECRLASPDVRLSARAGLGLLRRSRRLSHHGVQEALDGVGGDLATGPAEVLIADMTCPRQPDEEVFGPHLLEAPGESFTVLRRDEPITHPVHQERGRGAALHERDGGGSFVGLCRLLEWSAEVVPEDRARVWRHCLARAGIPVAKIGRGVQRYRAADGRIGGGVRHEQRELPRDRPPQDRQSGRI